MPKGTALDLRKKLIFLLRPKGLDVAEIVLDLSRGSKKVSSRTAADWMKANKREVPLYSNSRNALMACFEKHKIEFQPIWFELPYKVFVKRYNGTADDPANGLPNIGVPRSGTAASEKERRLEALAGTYQLIRPHTSHPDRYILEVMEVRSDIGKSEENLRMYSHNQPRLGQLYKGELFISNRYAFSLAHRQHDTEQRRLAMRSITMYVASREIPGGYTHRYCLSGVMLRGVKGESNPTMAVGVPFLAFRPAEAVCDLTKVQFERVRKSLATVSPGLLIGEVSAHSATPVFNFCRRVMTRLKKEMLRGFVLHTVHPSKVEDIVSPGHAREDAVDVAFQRWLRTVGKL